MRIVIFGLSITSSWGNGHATTYRGLVRALTTRGHDVLFLERDKPWYASQRDLPNPPFGSTKLYDSLEEVKDSYADEVRRADLVIIGSYVPEGQLLGDWILKTARGVRAFYDIDTPVTLANMERGSVDYLSPTQIRRYDLYLSFTGGPVLKLLESRFGSPAARVLYCSADPDLYFPKREPKRWDLGYLGTYSEDRQPALERLLIAPAQSWPGGCFAVAGSLYPEGLKWPENVERIEHIPPEAHRHFYNSQRITLNVTRADMVRAGYSPSIRLFEAAACGVPIVTDYWPGLETLFHIGREIFVAGSGTDILDLLKNTARPALKQVGARARSRVLERHTPAHRAAALEKYAAEAWEIKRRNKRVRRPEQPDERSGVKLDTVTVSTCAEPAEL